MMTNLLTVETWDAWICSKERAEAVKDLVVVYDLLMEKKLGGIGEASVNLRGRFFGRPRAAEMVVDLLRFPEMVVITLKGFPGTPINGRQRRLAAQIFETLRSSQEYGRVKREAVRDFFRRNGWKMAAGSLRGCPGVSGGVPPANPMMRSCYFRDYTIRRLGLSSLAAELVHPRHDGKVAVYYPDDALSHIHHMFALPTTLPLDAGDPRVVQIGRLAEEVSRFDYGAPIPPWVFSWFVTRESSW